MRKICKANKDLQTLTKQWTLHLIKKLEEGPMRNKDLLTSTPISGKVLATRIKELLLMGIIKKDEKHYHLTTKGHLAAKLLKKFEDLFEN